LTIKNRPAGAPLIATSHVKHSQVFQKRFKVETKKAPNLSEAVKEQIQRISRRVYRALYLSGYARIDLRLTPKGIPYVIEANPNPDISEDEEFSEAAHHCGIAYPELLERILRCGLDRDFSPF
jgi:D-alanine-D-alanine ligase